MLAFYDFRCKCGQVFEAFVNTSIRNVRCSCGDEANRLISPVRCQLDGASGDFPGAAMRWEKRRGEQIKHERKREDTSPQ